MRWRAKAPKPEPKEGDTQRRLVYTWLPKRTHDGWWYWLEHVWQVRTYARRNVYIRGVRIGYTLFWRHMHYEPKSPASQRIATGIEPTVPWERG